VWVRLCFCFLPGIFLPPIDHKFAEQKFQNKIAEHGNDQNDKVIDSASFRQITQPGGQGREDQIETKDLCHGNGNIGGRLERVAPVQRKVPENRKEEFYKLLQDVDSYENARLIDGAVETIYELSKKYDILMCSSCVMFFNMKGSGIYFKHKYDFLVRTFPYLDPHKFILTGYKNALVADVQIDDRLDNLESKNIKTKLLMTAYHNKNITEEELQEKGVIRVNSWQEIKKILLKNG